MDRYDTVTLTEFRDRYPVGQNSHTGRWGWRRVSGCLNLNLCHFATEGEARADRDATIREGRIDPESGQPC